MHRTTGLLGGVVLALLAALPATAQDRYIEDTVFVPLRDGVGNDQRILHKGLPSGTAVVLVEENKDAGWALVRTREGLEGWLPARYLKREPGARWQVGNALRLLGQPDDGSVTLTAAIEQGRAQLDALTAERDTLQAELAEGRQLWTNTEELDATNRQLTEQVQVLRSRIDVLEAENRRLNDETWKHWFINGVWATGVGGLLTLLLPRLLQRRKRYSEWA